MIVVELERPSGDALRQTLKSKRPCCAGLESRVGQVWPVRGLRSQVDPEQVDPEAEHGLAQVAEFGEQ